MGFPHGEGGFEPTSARDKKMWIANKIAYEARHAIFAEEGYWASAGVANNKGVAMLACNNNKPGGQTVIPECYKKRALAKVQIKSLR